MQVGRGQHGAGDCEDRLLGTAPALDAHELRARTRPSCASQPRPHHHTPGFTSSETNRRHKPPGRELGSGTPGPSIGDASNVRDSRISTDRNGANRGRILVPYPTRSGCLHEPCGCQRFGNSALTSRRRARSVSMSATFAPDPYPPEAQPLHHDDSSTRGYIVKRSTIAVRPRRSCKRRKGTTDIAALV